MFRLGPRLDSTYLALPRLGALPCLAVPYLASPYLTLPCRTLPCRTLPCLTQLTLPCLALLDNSSDGLGWERAEALSPPPTQRFYTMLHWGEIQFEKVTENSRDFIFHKAFPPSTTLYFTGLRSYVQYSTYVCTFVCLYVCMSVRLYMYVT